MADFLTVSVPERRKYSVWTPDMFTLRKCLAVLGMWKQYNLLYSTIT